MSAYRRKDLLDRTFEVAIVLKGLDGVLEVVGGLILLVVSPATINRIVAALTQHELSQDPHDLLATRLLNTAHGLTKGSVLFASLYLLTHGAVKIVLVVALLKNKLWAYPWMIAFLLLFIGYQIYRILLVPSAALAALTAFDLFVVWLTYREYQRQRYRIAARHGAAGRRAVR
ncbi:MAG TPA: DUF2127 domain-containing protein [Candidatus Dormibacteraeota bacterium]|nr:DUF2127 domain-containing protein [Candidatus Dormibacteraeota bacterium]